MMDNISTVQDLAQIVSSVKLAYANSFARTRSRLGFRFIGICLTGALILNMIFRAHEAILRHNQNNFGRERVIFLAFGAVEILVWWGAGLTLRPSHSLLTNRSNVLVVPL